MLVNISTAAKMLGCSPEHIRRMIRLGKWPYYTLGPRATRIDVEEICSMGRMISEIERRGRNLKHD
jgi:excisionase family DNA binding protein